MKPFRRIPEYNSNTMKKFILLLAVAHLSLGMARPVEIPMNNFNNGFIFVERGITFSVYPDGEFDFFMDNQVGVNANLRVGAVGITFNSGFDYSPFVQYDDFGAVIQIEHVPIYYDYYGRVSRIGNIGIWYRNNRLYRIGGMNIFYNPSGFYAYHTGFINVYNRNYIFNPFHNYFVRPIGGFCLVSRNPYRRTYRPIRYRYYEPYRYNQRRAYARVGNVHKHSIREERDRVYINNARRNSRNSASEIASFRNNSERRGTVRTNSPRVDNRSVRTGSGNRIGQGKTGQGNRVTTAPSRGPQSRSAVSSRRYSGFNPQNESGTRIERNSAPRYQNRSATPSGVQRSTSGNRNSIRKNTNASRPNLNTRSVRENQRSTGNRTSTSRRTGNN